MALSPLRASLKSLRIAFRSIEQPEPVARFYRCELLGRSASGTVYRVRAQHPDGNTAIMDALARARRAITRDRWRSFRS